MLVQSARKRAAVFSVIVALLANPIVAGSQLFLLGSAGESCFDACFRQGFNCETRILTQNTIEPFTAAGYNCPSQALSTWDSAWQPGVDAKGNCKGFVNVSGGVGCQSSMTGQRRLCSCNVPNATYGPIGMAYSQGEVDTTERTMFAQRLNTEMNVTGTMNHFWLTPCSESLIVRYYVDGEQNASIAFHPWLASGYGPWQHNNSPPWGTKWFGKASKHGSWSWNFPVPFQESIRITIQADTPAGLYMIVRGVLNVSAQIGSIQLPHGAKLRQFTTNRTLAPLELIDLAALEPTVGVDGGLFFMHTIALESGTPNMLEGCYHWYRTYGEEWPGLLLSSGTEDFFDSGWYFDAGTYRARVSGATDAQWINQSLARVSAYRFHDVDYLTFGNEGFRFQWRNGDLQDDSGLKCFVAPWQVANGAGGASPVGRPVQTKILAYAWVYTWSY